MSTPVHTSLTRMSHSAASVASYLAQPAVVLVLRRAAFVLLSAWIALSLWRGVLSLLPIAPPVPPTTPINPMTTSAAADPRTDVDIDRLASVPLFGTPTAGAEAELLAAQGGRAPTMSEEEAAEALAGIEEGAPQTRLPLSLRGVVAASEAGLGQAMIEYQNRQDLYQVGDDLPVSGNVVLAKVLPTQVVLDNSGRYEVLNLFEESGFVRPTSTAFAPAGSRAAPVPGTATPSRSTEPAGATSAAIAARYRARLYENPESLVDVVTVSAVRDGDRLRGYRVMPGKAADEFTALGFEAGDIVTAVNGLSLSDPSNTMRLYQAMRSATAARFDLERNGESITLDVALDSTGSGF